MAQHDRKAALATLGAATGLAFGPSTMLVFAFGSFVPALQSEFGWSRPDIMVAATILSLMIVVASPIQGLLIDRFGSRRVILPSAVAFAGGLAAFSQLPNSLMAFYAAYLLLPLLAVGIWPVGYLRVVSTWFDRRLGLALGIANSGIGIGAALLPLLAAVAIADGNWRSAYIWFAGIAIAALILNAFVLVERDSAGHHQEDAVHDPRAIDFQAVRKTASFRTLVLAYFTLGFVTTGFVVNQTSLLIDGGASPAHAAFVQTTYGVAVIAGRLIVGFLLDYFRAASVMFVSCLAATAALLIYASGSVGWPAYLSAALLGFVLGAEFDVAAYLVRRMYGVAVFGRAYGFLYATFQLATAIGVYGLAVSQQQTGCYAVGMLGYASSTTIAALCFWRLGNLQQRHPDNGGKQPA